VVNAVASRDVGLRLHDRAAAPAAGARVRAVAVQRLRVAATAIAATFGAAHAEALDRLGY
jgi:hypothetical protein